MTRNEICTCGHFVDDHVTIGGKVLCTMCGCGHSILKGASMTITHCDVDDCEAEANLQVQVIRGEWAGMHVDACTVEHASLHLAQLQEQIDAKNPPTEIREGA